MTDRHRLRDLHELRIEIVQSCLVARVVQEHLDHSDPEAGVGRLCRESDPLRRVIYLHRFLLAHAAASEHLHLVHHAVKLPA